MERAAGELPEIGRAAPRPHPARPDRSELLSRRNVPRRRPGSPACRIALLHAVAHIELNAVDLHRDSIARFAETPMPMALYDDWVKAPEEELKPFNQLAD